MGDAVYGLSAMRDLGGGFLYLCSRPWCKEMTQARFDTLKPLLESQSYIHGVAWHKGEPITHDFTTFRPMIVGNKTLAEVQARYVGARERGSDTQWIHLDGFPKHDRIIVHRSPRWRNGGFPWRELVEQYGGQMLFVGPEDEWRQFVDESGMVQRHTCKDFLELARLIAGSPLFIGNQSAPYAIAEGLKHNTVQETNPRRADCVFRRPNAEFCDGDTARLPGGVTIRARERYFKLPNAALPVRQWDGNFFHPKITRIFGGVAEGVYATRDGEEVARLFAKHNAIELDKRQYETQIARAA